MSHKLSRREFTLAAASLAVAASAQEAKKPAVKKPTAAELMAEADFKSLESKLEKPLPDKLKGLAKTALSNNRKAAEARRKFALPEGTEPCTTYIPSSARVTDR